MADAFKIHVRRGRVEGGKLELFLPRRREAVWVPESWCKFVKRSIPPQYRNRPNKFPWTLTMPADLAAKTELMK